MGCISIMKKWEDKYFFFSECYKKDPYTPLARKRGVLKKQRMETLPQLFTTILLYHTPMGIQACWIRKKNDASIGQKGTVIKLVKMEKTPTDSERIMQAFANLGIPYDPKSLKQLQFEDNNFFLCEESYTPLSIFERTSFWILMGNLDGCVTPISTTRLMHNLIP